MSGSAEGGKVPRIEVDLRAVRANVSALRERLGGRLLVVVKADAYGHGAVPVARAALAAGAEQLGVVDLQEALELREAGVEAPIVAWLHGPHTRWRRAFEAGVELGVSSLEQLALVAEAAQAHRAAGGAAPVLHLKVDTGLGRGGAPRADWPALFGAAADLERAGTARVSGLLSHFSGTSEACDREQLERFGEACRLARAAGLRTGVRHLGASAAALGPLALGDDMARIGIAAYGLSPFADGRPPGVELRPALRLLAPLVAITDRAGVGRCAIELGTADGLPPLEDGSGLLLRDERGGRWRIAAQWETHTIVQPADDAAVRALPEIRRGRGPELVVIGSGGREPGADEWARAADTINYEIVTRLSSRIDREYLGAGEDPAPPTGPLRRARRP
ncbi:MAG: alanine racemase, partial [Pseudoclavibacter sp.]|nr:alanine racemase [Pseudoclavibacter sp.]